MRNIVNFEGKYSITSDGRVWSDKNNLFLKLITAPNGYLKVNLSKNGVAKSYYAHRLVAQAFIPNPKNKRECNHIDGNRGNNDVSNIEWCTHKENIIHSFKSLHRQAARGERHGMSKLTEQDVLTVRQLLSEGNLWQKEIGRLFGVSAPTISYIKSKKTWSWT